MPVIGNCLLHENTPRILRLSSLSSKEDNEPIPILRYFLNIEGATAAHSCLENRSGTKYKKYFYCISVKKYSIY